MQPFSHLVFKLANSALTLVLLLSGCSTPTTNPQQASSHVEQDIDIPPPDVKDPVIVKYISERSHSYIYLGHQEYERKAMGYTLNYMHELEPERVAEFYIFPLPKELKNTDKSEVVFGFTKHTLAEIFEAADLGYFSDLEIKDKTAWRFNDTVLTEVSLTLVANGNKKLKVIYLSEFGDYILRAQITMADIEINQNHNSKDFVRQTFLEIINGLQQESINYQH